MFEVSQHQGRPDEKTSGYDNDVGEEATLATDSVGTSVTGCSQPVQWSNHQVTRRMFTRRR
jgi:hypothetical protein